MALKKKKIIKKEEPKKKEEAKPVVKKAEPKKVVKKEMPKTNELVLRKGDEVEVKGLSFAIEEVYGLKIVLKRTDIK